MQHNASIIALVAIVAMSVGGSHRAAAEIKRRACVSEFDLSRYVGKWYEIARFENRFERGLESVTAQYIERSDGSIEVVNRGFNTSTGEWSEAIGRAKESSVKGLLRVSFFLFFYSDYRILALGLGDDSSTSQYQWALVGSKSPKYLWILARESTLPPSTIDYIIEIMEAKGYDSSRLKFVDHSL